MEKNKNLFKVDFIGVGAPKCASSWLYKCLIEHPQICGPEKKELNFFLREKQPFDRSAEKRKFLRKLGINFYKNYFARCPENSIKGEFSPRYMYDSTVATEIKKHFPDVKILFCLRNPVKRAYSYYWFKKEFGLEEKNDTFEKALKNNYKAYIDYGMYFKYMQPFYDVFEKKNILVILVDDIKKDPYSVIREAYSFLRVDTDFIPPSINTKRNSARRSKYPFLKKAIEKFIALMLSFFRFTRTYFVVEWLIKIGAEDFLIKLERNSNKEEIKKPEINNKTVFLLKSIFKKDVEKLEKLINRNLDDWK